MGLHLHLLQCRVVLTLAFIVFLFRRDIRERPDVSGALWLPLIWLVLTCSRALSAWLNIFGLPVVARHQWKREVRWTRGFYLALTTAGFCVLIKRQVSLSEVVRNNGWLIVFLFIVSFPSPGRIFPSLLSSGGSKFLVIRSWRSSFLRNRIPKKR